MERSILLATLCVVLACSCGVHTEAQGVGQPVPVADTFYWAYPEGNLGIEITGKFQSEQQLVQTLALLKQIGVFKSKKYPFQPRTWVLRDILVSVDFNGAGPVATWRVSGPKPLLLQYVGDLKERSEDRSLFYDFGYRFVNFRPSTD